MKSQVCTFNEGNVLVGTLSEYCLDGCSIDVNIEEL